MALAFLQSASSTANETVYTFSAQNLGTASADRYIIIGHHSRSAGATDISTVTIGGVSATTGIANVDGDPGANTNRTFFSIANVPTGTTGDVVVTYNAGQARAAIGMWAVTGLASATPTDTATSVADDPTQSTLDVIAGGFAIGIAMTSADTTTTWTGVTEKYDGVVEASITVSGGSDTFPTTQTNLTITADFVTGADSAGSFASWEISVAAGPANLKSLDTNLKANIKSINTNLIANVKSLDTNV